MATLKEIDLKPIIEQSICGSCSLSKKKNVVKNIKQKEYPVKNVRNLTNRHDSIYFSLFTIFE